MENIVITRHPALVDYLRELGVVPPDTPVIAHATPAQVAGRHVFGVLPLSLAAHAARVTEIPLRLTADDRGKELSLERVKAIALPPATYVVRAVLRDD